MTTDRVWVCPVCKWRIADELATGHNADTDYLMTGVVRCQFCHEEMVLKEGDWEGKA